LIYNQTFLAKLYSKPAIQMKNLKNKIKLNSKQNQTSIFSI